LFTFSKSGKFLALIFFLTGFMPVSGSYKHKVGDVVVIADQKDSMIVKELAGFAMEAQHINNHFFIHRLQQVIYVYLTDSESDYHKFSTTKIPEWSSGVAFINQHIIVLKPGKYYNPVQYRETIIHEISHIYMAEKLDMNNILPVWLNEGTAMYLSGKSLSWEENIVLGNAMAANNLLDLEAIDSLYSFTTTKANLAYLESFLAVQFLVEQHGEKKLAAIISSLAKSRSLDQAFLDILGYDFFDFEIKWFDNFKSQFRWIAFLQFENLFFLILVLIIMLALVVRRYRNKKIYQRWEEEDMELL
jgi:hypothetical protein